jgi:anthranilate phosphoribosyltransferase
VGALTASRSGAARGGSLRVIADKVTAYTKAVQSPEKLVGQVIHTKDPLTREEARTAMAGVLRGEVADADLSAMLVALSARGETAAEIAGFVEAMRAAALTLPLTDAERSVLVDTCGTGGDAMTNTGACATFNISTAVAIVAAAAGAKVAKSGNRSVTSLSGSADVLEALGVAVNLDAAACVQTLRATGFMYLHAPVMHPAMKHVMPVRRALGVRTVFNILGPLTNPAGARRQVMGVYSAHLVPLVGEALAMLGTEHAFVVHGSDGLDELTITGASSVAEVRGNTLSLRQIAPGDVGLTPAAITALHGGDAKENAEILRSIFAGEKSPRRDVVLLNAAAVLVAAGVAKAMTDGAKLAAAAIDSGGALDVLAKLQR